MARITNSQRDNIIKKESVKRYHDKEQELEKSFKESLEKQARKTLPEFINDDLISSGFLNTSSEIQVRGISDPDNYSARNRGYGSYSMYNSIPIKNYRNTSIEVTKTIQNKVNKLREMQEDRLQFRRKLRTILYSYTTDTKLLEAVPELASYFTAKQAASTMAMVPIEQLNEVRKALKQSNK